MADITPLPANLQGPPPVNPTPTKEQVEAAINESSSLVEALESVGALYGIPSENIIVDDRVNGIEVRGDTILAPDRHNPSANTKAIVCAIGAVLDHISQRIDQKLGAYQAKQIEENRLKSKMRTPNPSKGEVIDRVFDANGDEILIYSTGLIDYESTPEANAKIAELRAAGKIPEYHPTPTAPPKSSYFTDEENDIMHGTSTSVPSTDNMQVQLNKASHDISSAIHESALHLDLYDEYHQTKFLGCEIMRQLGYDFVEPIQTLVQEAITQPAPADPSELQHMRFDNTQLKKAVQLFNKAYKEIGRESPPVEELCKHDAFKEGIRAIERQFDCHLAVRFFNLRDESGQLVTDGFTSQYQDIRQKITISKSKGFRLNGTNVDIFFAGRIFEINPASRSAETFGQSVMSIILHEIFHNIFESIRRQNDTFIFTMSSGVILASQTDNLKNRRAILANAVNAASSVSGRKVSRGEKRRMVRQLMTVAATRFEAEKIKLVQSKAIASASDSEIQDLDEYIAKLEIARGKFQRSYEKGKNKKEFKHKGTIGGLLAGIGIALTCTIALAPVGIPMILIGDAVMNASVKDEVLYAKQVDEWLKRTDKEEYYCDLFASMYGFPQVFMVGNLGSKLTANMVDKERLAKVTALERDLGKFVFDPHPSGQERSLAGLKVARQLLAYKDLDPDVKKYCEWVVANYSSLDDTDLNEIYQANVFDPKEAEDLDKHLQNIARNNNVAVTESYKT